MKSMKKLLAILLVAASVLTLPGFSMVSWAEENDVGEEVTSEAAQVPAEAVVEAAEEEPAALPAELEAEEEIESAEEPEAAGEIEPAEEPEAAGEIEPAADDEAIAEPGEAGEKTYLPGLAPTQQQMDDATEIFVGGAYTANITAENGCYAYFKFIPEANGYYVFTSNSSSDTYGFLFDENGSEITYDDDAGSGNNFKISYSLTAGQTYYFGATFYGVPQGDEIEGSYSVSLDVVKSTWREENGEWYYVYPDGSYATGFQTIDGTMYYFREYDSRMAHDTVVQDWDNYRLYEAASSGALTLYTEGWHQCSGEWYYVNKNGTFAQGLQTINGTQYYFYSDGQMAHDTSVGYDGETYFADSNGALTTGIPSKPGWFQVGATWYYSENGELKYGWLNDGGKEYYLNPYMLTNEVIPDYENECYYGVGADGVKVKNGWVKRTGTWDGNTWEEWYYAGSDGKLISGWLSDGGKWYYFEEEGDYYPYMYSDGPREIDGEWYFFSAGGAMQTGWCKQTGTYTDENGQQRTWTNWFYADGSGVLLTGWQVIGGKKYYFANNNNYPYMYSDSSYEIDGKLYYFTVSGALAGKGWQSQTGTNTYGETWTNWYYTDKEGIVQTGWQTISGEKYYFDPDWGYMYSSGIYGGPQVIDGTYYYFKPSGALGIGWQKRTYNDGSYDWFYTDDEGIIQTGWQEIDGKTYYFYPDWGYMYYNSVRDIDGAYYFFTSSGARAEAGWYSRVYIINGVAETDWYYTDEEGVVQTGWQEIDGTTYYFYDPYGWMYCDTVVDIDGDGKLEYFDPSGALVENSGWVEVDGNIRYKVNGSYVTGWRKIGNKWYVFDNNGNQKTKCWIESGGKWYYLAPAMLTNSVRYIDGAYYYFEASGALRTTVGWVSYKEDYNGTLYSDWFYVKSGNGDLANQEWVQSGGKWYYFSPNMVYNTWVEIDGYRYHFDANGAWTGEQIPA